MAGFYVQVAQEFLRAVAPHLAAQVDVSRHEAIGLASDIFNRCLERGVALYEKELSWHDGWVFPGPKGAAFLEAAIDWRGERGAFAAACLTVGIAERTDDGGLRVKGSDRYDNMFEAMAKERQRGRDRRAQDNGEPDGHPPGRPPVHPEGHPPGRRGNLRPKSLDPKPKIPPPPAGEPEPLAEPVEVEGRKEWSREDLSTWPGFLGWWNAERVTEGLAREDDHPNGPTWHQKALKHCGGDPYVLCDASRLYLDDPKIEAPGHPIAVFMKDSVWPSRVRGTGPPRRRRSDGDRPCQVPGCENGATATDPSGTWTCYPHLAELIRDQVGDSP